MARKGHLELTLALLGITVLSGYSSCGEDILGDPGFDMWCGDQLCSWEVEQGSVERVPTWHEQDDGASLVGERVAISQYAAIDQLDVSCIYFTMLADADPGATMLLELDFLDDGQPEYVHEIPAEDWENIGYHITPPEWFWGVRFRIRKEGEERAVIAQLRAQVESADACTAAPLELSDRPSGAECSEHDDCADGVCAELDLLNSSGTPWSVDTCGSCTAWTGCAADQACGLEFGAQDLPFQGCGEQARHALGEACVLDDECETGLCVSGQCSECDPVIPECAGDQVCTRTGTPPHATPYLLSPHMCSPGDHHRARGEPCIHDDDCASFSCERSELLSICDPTGRPCESDDDCVVYGLVGQCHTIGARDGVCG